MNLKDFHYLVSGGPTAAKNSPWIVFLHGLLGSLANWRRVAAAFEKDFRILTFDQRGHGKSFHPVTGYAPEDFAGDLLFLMDALGIKKATLVGHSMGGRNALCFAHLHPGRVEKLVIEDIGPEASFVNGSQLIERLKKVPVPFSDKRAAKEYFLNEFRDPKLGNFLYTNIVLNAQQKAVWSFNLRAIVEIIEKGRGTERWAEVQSLSMPTLVIRGTESDELPVPEFEKMKACNPRVQGVEFQNAGHWVHFDQPDKFVEAVRKFLVP